MRSPKRSSLYWPRPHRDGIFVAAASGYASVQMIDITDPATHARAAPVGVGLDGYVIYGNPGVKMVQDGYNTYLLFQTLDENTTLIFDIADPYSAVPLSVIAAGPQPGTSGPHGQWDRAAGCRSRAGLLYQLEPGRGPAWDVTRWLSVSFGRLCPLPCTARRPSPQRISC